MTDAANALPYGAGPPVVTAPPEIQRAVSSSPTEAIGPGEMMLRKDCKIYDRTSKDPQVIGVKYNGTSIVKTEESKYWIGFALSPAQKGFVAKTCF